MSEETMTEKKEMKKEIIIFMKRFIVLLIGVSIISLGGSLAIKANLGVAAWDAVGLSISNITGIKVGYMYLILNGTCIVIQLLLEKKEFRPMEFLQILNVTVVGMLINFFVYRVFIHWEMGSYIIPIFKYNLDIIRLLWVNIAYIVTAYGVSLVFESKLIRNPLEGVCLIVAKRIGSEMGKLRQLVDILFIVITLILIFVSHTAFTLREGTIVCMLVFGPMLDVWSKWNKKLLVKLNVE